MTYDYQTPRYIHVMEEIKAKISEGELEPGIRLPSELEFAKQLNVSRNTLREALRILEEEHIIIRKHGIGTFINKKPVFSGGIEELFSITDFIKREGKEPGTNLLFQGVVDPRVEDADELKLNATDRIYLVKRVRTANDEPLVYCIDKVPVSIIGEDYQFNEESMLDSFQTEKGITISYAKADIKTIGFHEEISETLAAEPDEPLLVLKQIHYDTKDQPVLYSLNFFRANQVSFSVIRKRIL
ncbi:GntR family transcriptional regulator [Gracilibacillus sp. S3-1-1]|uniref:GntR family transcriptional regulator n=1 Tax=Gracilibacillus pellucidus TaxID=3095368 RepID=A0ACC6M1R3_9BACI|nr:GntR family transcriptional regulator [Gracilibacillus sp. S3-1-1]MDX8044836.1 GntR family transcriptional regulator [Gracilibacillus sp. S3-1-1]